MKDYFVSPIYHKLKKNHLVISVPGSKSITNRAFLLAAMANGKSLLKGVLFCDDSRNFLSCLENIGFKIYQDEKNRTIEIFGLGGEVPKQEAKVYVGSAGTAARFITAFLGLKGGKYLIESSEQMRKRPMGSLLHSLEQVGAKVYFKGEKDHFPFCLEGRGEKIGKESLDITIDVQKSSQFLSALLISACRTKKEVQVKAIGEHGMSYVDMTIRMMASFGVNVERIEGTYHISKDAVYQCREYEIEPDVSAACYFYAMCPILGIQVTVQGVRKESLQGDLYFLDLLVEMGCDLQSSEKGLTLFPPKEGVYHGIKADMSTCSDQAITMAVVAIFAENPTIITGISHIKYQESNRLEAICTELKRMGIRCEKTEDSLTIYPGTPKPSVVNTYEDHRMAMGFSLVGLRCPGMVIKNPGCCKKTFENYFEVLENTINQLS